MSAGRRTCSITGRANSRRIYQRQGDEMRIAIMGSGGLGGYFGARLARGRAEVHSVARGAHLEAMRSQGLRIEGPEPMHLPQVSVTDNPAGIGVVDVVMLAVK